jgi:hypothetical protein
MRMSITRAVFTVAIASCVSLIGSNDACGQYAVTTVQSSAPAVIGYTAERRGLFGLRTAYRPIVGTVPVQKTVIVQQRPVYVPAPVYVQRPAVVYTAPVTTYLAPVPQQIPVTTYYTPVYPRY